MEDNNAPSFLKSTLYAFGLVLAFAVALGGLYSLSPPDTGPTDMAQR